MAIVSLDQLERFRKTIQALPPNTKVSSTVLLVSEGRLPLARLIGL